MFVSAVDASTNNRQNDIIKPKAEAHLCMLGNKMHSLSYSVATVRMLILKFVSYNVNST